MSVSALATLGVKQDPNGHGQCSGSEKPSATVFNRTPLLLLRMPLQDWDPNPAGCEAGGLGRAQGGKQCRRCLGLDTVKKFLHPSHSCPAQGLFLTGLDQVSECQPSLNGVFALYVGTELSGCK